MSRDSVAVETERALGPSWLTMLDRFSVHFLALDLEDDRELVEFFLSQPGWVVDCRDEESVLFARAGDVQGSDGSVAVHRSAIPAKPGQFARLRRS